MQNLKIRTVKDSLYRLYDAREKYQEAKKYYDDVRKKESVIVSNYVFTSLDGKKTFDIELDEGINFYNNKTTFSVSSYRKQKVNWIIDRIKKTINKSVYNQFIDKTYTVNNMAGLVEYLRKIGADPKTFKRFIDVEESVNVDKLNKLYELGEIKKRDLRECYTVEYGEPCVRMVKKSKNDKAI